MNRRKSASRLHVRAVAFAAAVALGAGPTTAFSSTISTQINLWLGGSTDTDWFTGANWWAGDVLALPLSLLPTVIGPSQILVEGIPTGQFIGPSTEAVLSGSFSTPQFDMYAWGGISQLRLQSGGLLTAATGTIGRLNPDYPAGNFSPATIFMDGGSTAGSWQFLADSRVVVNALYSNAQSGWYGTLGSLQVNAGAQFVLGSSLQVAGSISNAGQVSVESGSQLSVAGVLSNTGTFSVGADGVNTRLVLSGDTTLSGSGTTILGNGAHVSANNGTNTLTIGGGHTVQGTGYLGSTTYGGINVVNLGTLQVAGGTMTSYVGSFDNGAGVVKVADGATFDLYSGTLTGGAIQGKGVLASSAGATFQDVALSGGLHLQGGTLNGVRISDTLTLDAGRTASLSGQVVNDGTFVMAAGNMTRLNLAGDTTLSGTGVTVLGADSHISAYNGSNTLTIASGHTVQGAGYLGSTTYGGINVVNGGTVQASGGTMTSYVGNFDNSAGVVKVAGGATFDLYSGTLSGGAIQGTGVLTSSGGATLQGVALSGGLHLQGGVLDAVSIADTLTLDAGHSAAIGGTIVNNGIFRMASGDTTRLNLLSDTMLSGTGVTVLSTNSHISAYNGSSTLTIASGHTVQGSGYLGSTTYGGINVVNRGTVQATGGTMTSYVGTFDNSGGLVQVADGSAFNLYGGTLGGGTIQGLGSDSRLSGNGVYQGSKLTGTLKVAEGDLVNIAGVFDVQGTLAVGGSQSVARLILSGDATLSGSGSTLLGSQAHVSANNGSSTLTIGSGHTVQGTGYLGSTTYGSLNVVNKGTVQVTGGTMSSYVGSFDNGAGVVKVAGGATFDLYAGTLSGGAIQGTGTLTSSAGATLKGIALSGGLHLQGGTLEGVSIADTLTLDAGYTAGLSGQIVNNGTVVMAAGSTNRLNLIGDTTLSGAGVTVLSASSHVSSNDGSRTLTVGTGHTVQGAGYLGSTLYGSLNVVNRGTVQATGGTMTSYVGSFDNSGGLVQIADGSAFSLYGGTLGGGTLQGLGSDSRLSGNGVYQGSKLTGALQVAGGDLINIAGAFDVQGTLLVGGSQSHARLNLLGDTTLSGSGTTILGNGAHVSANNGTRTLTIGSGHTVQGAGYLGSTTYGGINVVNRGTVQVTGGMMTSYVGNFDNSAGRVKIAGGAVFDLYGGTLSGGTIQGTGDAQLSSTGGGVIRDVALAGSLALGNGRQAYVSGTIVNDASFKLAGADASTVLYLYDDTTLSGSGTFTLGGTNNYVASSGATRTLTIGADQTVQGAGQLGSTRFGLVDVVNNGVLSPGFSPGKLDIGGSLTLSDSSVLKIDIDGYARGTEYDWLAVWGGGTLDGTVQIKFGDGFNAALGDHFDFLTFGGAYTGTFDAVYANGYLMDVTYDVGAVRLTVAAVTAVPEPGTWALLLVGLGGMGIAARRRQRPGSALH